MFVVIIHSVYVEPKWELWMVCGLQLGMRLQEKH